MKAQEWLDELEQLREAATPGPWKHDKWIIKSLEARKIAQTISLDNSAYIVAACNAVPMLIDMIEYLAGRLCDEDHGDNDFDGKIQDAFEMTEPKE